MLVELAWVVLVVLMFLDGSGDEDIEVCSGGMLTVATFLFFRLCLRFAILRNLWMMRMLRIARVTMGPTRRNVSLMKMYILNT